MMSKELCAQIVAIIGDVQDMTIASAWADVFPKVTECALTAEQGVVYSRLELQVKSIFNYGKRFGHIKLMEWGT